MLGFDLKNAVEEQKRPSTAADGDIQKYCAQCERFMVEPVNLKCYHRCCLFCTRGIMNEDVEKNCPICLTQKKKTNLFHKKGYL